MALTQAPAGQRTDRLFTISRVIDAPLERVFAAWTDPSLLARWWGPHSFTNPVCDLDLREGGAYRIVMRSAEGTDYPITGEFREIARPQRLVLTMNCREHPAEWHDLVKPGRGRGEDNPAGTMLTTVTLGAEDGRTRLMIQTEFESAAIRDAMVGMGMTEGWSQSLERLQSLVGAVDGADRELAASRLLDAPAELVFRMFTDPNQVAQWWGPNGFTNTIETMDVRPEGEWRFVMHGPDGTDYQNRIVYREVDAPRRLVYDHVSGPRFHATVELTGQDSRTRLTMTMRFDSAAERERVVKKFGAAEGLAQTLGRLEEHLARVGPDGRGFVLTRAFAAPLDLVFRSWTETARLMEWWGPRHFDLVSCRNELQPGGVFHYGLRGPDGHMLWGKWVYREIIPPDELVFVASFADARGDTIRSPFSADWPLEVLSAVSLEGHGERTVLTLHGFPIHAADAEIAAFRAGHGSMHQGWTGTLDQLAAYLGRVACPR